MGTRLCICVCHDSNSAARKHLLALLSDIRSDSFDYIIISCGHNYLFHKKQSHHRYDMMKKC